MKPVNLSVMVSGDVNDGKLSGHASAVYSPLNNLIQGELTLDSFVPSFNELSASCSSIMSVNCSLFSRAVDGASNLARVLGNRVEGSAHFVMLKTENHNGHREVVGEIEQKFVLEHNGSGEAAGSTHLGGWYSRSDIL